MLENTNDQYQEIWKLNEIENYLEKYNSPKLTPEEVENWNRLISIGKIKF